MKYKLLAVLCSAILVWGCENNECDPGNLPSGEIIFLNIKNNNGTGYLKYANNTLPNDVTVTNLATNTNVQRDLIVDSVLVISDFNKANGSTTKFKIQKATNKPDTLEIVIGERTQKDLCGDDHITSYFTSMKVNATSLCTNCPGSNTFSYTRN